MARTYNKPLNEAQIKDNVAAAETAECNPTVRVFGWVATAGVVVYELAAVAATTVPARPIEAGGVALIGLITGTGVFSHLNRS